MAMRYLKASDDRPDSLARERGLQRRSHGELNAGHLLPSGLVKISPLIHLLAGNYQGVAWSERSDCQKGHHLGPFPNKAPWEITPNDLGENGVLGFGRISAHLSNTTSCSQGWHESLSGCTGLVAEHHFYGLAQVIDCNR